MPQECKNWPVILTTAALILAAVMISGCASGPATLERQNAKLRADYQSASRSVQALQVRLAKAEGDKHRWQWRSVEQEQEVRDLRLSLRAAQIALRDFETAREPGQSDGAITARPVP